MGPLLPPRLSRAGAAGAVLLALLAAPAARAQGWGGALGAGSDYVLRGITQSDGRPSLQADGHYAAAAGWFAGIWAASVQPPPDYGNEAELNVYAGGDLPLGDWSARIEATHYAYPGSSRQYDYDELSGRIAWLDRAAFTIAAAPNRAITGRGASARAAAVSYDLQLRQPCFAAVSATAGIGWYDLRRQRGAGYAYWNGGLDYGIGAFVASLNYIGTSRRAKALFYDAAEDRWVASLLWRY